MDEMFTCQEVAEHYKVKVLTVWDWIRKGRLSAIKIGKEYRISKSDLLEFEGELRASKSKEA